MIIWLDVSRLRTRVNPKAPRTEPMPRTASVSPYPPASSCSVRAATRASSAHRTLAGKMKSTAQDDPTHGGRVADIPSASDERRHEALGRRALFALSAPAEEDQAEDEERQAVEGEDRRHAGAGDDDAGDRGADGARDVDVDGAEHRRGEDLAGRRGSGMRAW